MQLSIFALASAALAVPTYSNLGQAIATTPAMSSREVIRGGPGNDLIDARNIQIDINNNQLSRRGLGHPGLGFGGLPLSAYNPFVTPFGFNGLYGNTLGWNNFGFNGLGFDGLGLNPVGFGGVAATGLQNNVVV